MAKRKSTDDGYAKLDSIPLAELIERVPSLELSLIERQGISQTAKDNLHVLFIYDAPNLQAEYSEESGYHGRTATTALLLAEPVSMLIAGSGIAIKRPEDPPMLKAGESHALRRALISFRDNPS